MAFSGLSERRGETIYCNTSGPGGGGGYLYNLSTGICRGWLSHSLA